MVTCEVAEGEPSGPAPAWLARARGVGLPLKAGVTVGALNRAAGALLFHPGLGETVAAGASSIAVAEAAPRKERDWRGSGNQGGLGGGGGGGCAKLHPLFEGARLMPIPEVIAECCGIKGDIRAR